MAAETFQTDLPDLQGFIKSLDLLDDNVNKSVRKNIKKGAGLIMSEQKRLIEGTAQWLADCIEMGVVYVTKNGTIGVTTGYQYDAFNYEDTARKKYRTHTVSRQGIVHDADYWRYADKEHAGVIGLMFEFGRPGKSIAHHRNSDTMKQVRRIRTATKTTRKGRVIKDRSKPAEPKEIDVKKGYVPASPHIRRGFDVKLEDAIGVIFSGINDEVKKVFNE